MKTGFKLTYLLGVGICSIALYNNQIVFCHFLRVFLAVILFLNYLVSKPNETKNILLILGVSTLFSSLPFIFLKPFDLQPDNLFHLFFLGVHACYISIFKIEKANAAAYKQKNYMIILIMIGFIFLLIINKYVSDFAFFALLLSTFLEVTMFWLAFSRKVNGKSYRLGCWAMASFALSNISFLIKFFAGFELMLIAVNLFYILAQFLLIESFLSNQIDVSKVELSNN